MGRVEAGTWAEVKALQADGAALVAKMKALAKGQATAIETAINAAIAGIEAAGRQVAKGGVTVKDDVKAADAAMLAAAHKAARSLSHAVAAMRSKDAHAAQAQELPA